MRRAVAAMVTLLVAGGTAVAQADASSADTCVQGAIATRYGQLGGAASKLGAPTSCEQATAGGAGRFTSFQGGAVYWSPATGAWDVSGSFRTLWAASGWENGFLGYPVSGEVGIKAGGVYQNYQGGTLYWSPSTTAHSVSGAFLGLYGSLGYENGFLGYPTSQEVPIRSGGVFQTFQGGVAYWSPTSGAHTVSGSFLGLYGSLGYENGCLGYPTSQETPSAKGGVYQRFQGGVAYWSPATGAHALCGAILGAYGAAGYENGSLGYPTTDEYGVGAGRRVDFQGGYVEWSAATGARVNSPVSPTVTIPTPSTPDVYYRNCTAARAAGAAPIYRGQPGYRPALDRDDDGIACE